MDNEKTQSMVAYEDGPKEVNTHKGMPGGDKQFGKGNKMPQDAKCSRKHASPRISHSRHGEHR
jgi:hypothetical protein